jgi:uncharacterized protein (DUF433 family)
MRHGGLFMYCGPQQISLAGKGRSPCRAREDCRSGLLGQNMESWGWEVAMATMEKVDWSECPLVEFKPGVQSGAAVLRGTRMPVSAIVDNFDYGVGAAEIAEQFEIPPERVETILTYANSHFIAIPLPSKPPRNAG